MGAASRVGTIPFPEVRSPMGISVSRNASDTVDRTRLFVGEASDSKLSVGLHGVFDVKEQL